MPQPRRYNRAVARQCAIIEILKKDKITIVVIVVSQIKKVTEAKVNRERHPTSEAVQGRALAG